MFVLVVGNNTHIREAVLVAFILAELSQLWRQEIISDRYEFRLLSETDFSGQRKGSMISKISFLFIDR